MKKINKFTYTVAAIIAVCFIVFSFFMGSGVVVHAATSVNTDSLYSDALTDLQKDSEFNELDFPANSKDYSIYVIQVAEGVNGNLYVYTYQPCQETKPLTATYINMSRTKEFTEPQLYDLRFVNNNGVFCKYLVRRFGVSSADTRYYNIASIYRAWDKDVDIGTGNNNTISNVSYEVRGVWSATTVEGEVHYEHEDTYVVNILDPYVDYLVYITDVSLFPDFIVPGFLYKLFYDKDYIGFIDNHYVAFSTDWPIDKLISADVHYYYTAATITYNEWFGRFPGDVKMSLGKSSDTIVTVEHTGKYVDEGSIWKNGFSYSYSWDLIQSVDDFINSEEGLTEETLVNLQGKQWVLRFAVTERTQVEADIMMGAYARYKSDFTVVDRVTILRLEFESNGVVYNLGAVSDEQSGDYVAGDTTFVNKEKESFWDWLTRMLGIDVSWLKVIIGILLAVILVALLWPILTPIFPLIGQGLLWLVRGIAWLVALPFKAIAALFKRKKDDAKNRS